MQSPRQQVRYTHIQFRALSWSGMFEQSPTLSGKITTPFALSLNGLNIIGQFSVLGPINKVPSVPRYVSALLQFEHLTGLLASLCP
jgi:hypothetical protein